MLNYELPSKGIPDSERQVTDENAASPEPHVELAELALEYLTARKQMNKDLDYSTSWSGDYFDWFASLEQDVIEAELITPKDSIFHQPKKQSS